MATASERLESLRTIPPNWDSYGADAPRAECIDAAAQLLRENPDVRKMGVPHISPTRIGGVLFAWHEGPHQLEIEIESPDRAGFVYLNSETDESAEGEFNLRRAFSHSPSPLKAIIDDLFVLVPA